DDAVQLVRQVGGDAIGAARPGGYLPQTAGAGGPERTVAGHHHGTQVSDRGAVVGGEDAPALAAGCVPPLQSTETADPQAARRVDGECVDGFAGIAVGGVRRQGEGLEVAAGGIVTGDAVGNGGEPEPPLRILGQCRDDTVGQAGGIVGIVLMDPE